MKRSDIENHLWLRPFLGRLGASPLGRYRSQIAGVLALLVAFSVAGCATKRPPPERLSADRVVVKKSERKLMLVKGGEVVREYRVALGDNPYGHKMHQGDERTPEGEYILDWRNPRSNYYKSIHVSYPNERDQLFARAMGMDPGGMIMIHGMPDYLRTPAVMRQFNRRDWTDGCIAVTNDEMEEIWRAVRDGTPIDIVP